MANTIKIKRGLEANRTLITPVVGEPLFTTDEKKLYIGDGATLGGVLLDDTTLGGKLLSSVGDNWDVVTWVSASGFVEVGKALHFHSESDSSADNYDFAIELPLTINSNMLFKNDAEATVFTLHNTGGVSVPSGDRVYLDGGSNTYLFEQNPDNIMLVTAAITRVTINASGLQVVGGITRDGNTVRDTGNFVAQTNFENFLGNPGADGFILSSTIAGTRSWIAPSSGPDHFVQAADPGGVDGDVWFDTDATPTFTVAWTDVTGRPEHYVQAADPGGVNGDIWFDTDATPTFAVVWTDVTGTPTTIAGYGITDIPQHFVQAADPGGVDGDIWFDTDATPAFTASDVSTVTTAFDNNLGVLDTDVQKALDTLDNMVAGSLNINIISKREEQVSTAAQTVITLSTIAYDPVIDNVSLYINGLNQAPSAFTLTNSVTLTLSESIAAGKILDIRVNEIISSVISDNTNEVTLHFYRNN